MTETTRNLNNDAEVALKIARQAAEMALDFFDRRTGQLHRREGVLSVEQEVASICIADPYCKHTRAVATIYTEILK